MLNRSFDQNQKSVVEPTEIKWFCYLERGEQMMGLFNKRSAWLSTHTLTHKHTPVQFVWMKLLLLSGWIRLVLTQTKSPSGYGSTLPDVCARSMFVPPDLGPIFLLLHDPPHLHRSLTPLPPRPFACSLCHRLPLPSLVFLTSSCSSSSSAPLFILSCPYGFCSQTEERLRPCRAATDLPAPHLHHHQWQQPPGWASHPPTPTPACQHPRLLRSSSMSHLDM